MITFSLLVLAISGIIQFTSTDAKKALAEKFVPKEDEVPEQFVSQEDKPPKKFVPPEDKVPEQSVAQEDKPPKKFVPPEDKESSFPSGNPKNKRNVTDTKYLKLLNLAFDNEDHIHRLFPFHPYKPVDKILHVESGKFPHRKVETWYVISYKPVNSADSTCFARFVAYDGGKTADWKNIFVEDLKCDYPVVSMIPMWENPPTGTNLNDYIDLIKLVHENQAHVPPTSQIIYDYPEFEIAGISSVKIGKIPGNKMRWYTIWFHLRNVALSKCGVRFLFLQDKKEITWKNIVVDSLRCDSFNAYFRLPIMKYLKYVQPQHL